VKAEMDSDWFGTWDTLSITIVVESFTDSDNYKIVITVEGISDEIVKTD
jgi:hypothetical protein